MVNEKFPIEAWDLLDSLVEEEFDRHPKLKTDLGKMYFIRGALIVGNPQLLRILGVREKTLLDHETFSIEDLSIPDELRSRFNLTFAVASILERETPDVFERYAKINPHLAMLEQGKAAEILLRPRNN